MKVLGQLMKRSDAKDWFNEPVPAGTEGYFETIKSPMDYGTILSKLEANSYESPASFASDVRLVASNATTYSPEADNECHKAAKANLAAFETAYLKEKLATDGGAAAEAAKAAITRKRGRD